MQDLVSFDGISIVILFGLVQAVVIMYLFATKKRFIEHKPIIFIVCVITIIMIESLFLRSGLMSKYPHILNISTPFLFLLGPLTYFYVLSQLGQKTGLKTKMLHFVVFGFYFLYSFNFFLQSAAYKYNIYVTGFHQNIDLIDATANFSIDPWNIQGWVVVELISLHLLIYCCSALYKTFVNFKKASFVSGQKFRWVIYINGIILISSVVIFLSHGGVVNGKVFFTSPFPKFSSDFLGTIIMYLLTVFILLNPDFFKLNAKKYSRSSLSKEYKVQKLQLIKSLLENEKIFLNSDFSLKTLAEKTGISTHHISQILNEELKSSFFQISNHYRISEAKKRLAEKDSFIKMEQLAFDLGYKSKSTFFKAFKKETSLTPSKYCETVSS